MAVVSRALPVSAAWLRAVPLWAVAGAVGGLTGLVRLAGFGPASDVFGDEVYYWRIGQSVHSGGFPGFHDGRFFLHPPGYFYLESGWERLFGARTDVISGVYEMRLLNVLLAALTAGVLVLLMARVSRSTPAAITVGVLFALDPFALRINGRVLLETSMMLWVVLGYLVLLPLAGQDPRSRTRPRAAAAGLLFGLAVVTKDVAALITVLPLLAAAVFVWPSRRSLPLLAAGCAIVPYGIYVCVVAATGHFQELWAAKTYGVRRLLGQIQETGFNSPNAPALSQRVTEGLSNFGSSYVLLALGPLALVALLRWGGAPRRLLVLWYLSAGFALTYAVLQGTLEEQELYLLLVPTMVVVVLAALHLSERRTGRPRQRVSIRAVGTVLVLVLVLTSSAITYASGRSQPDDGYARLRQYMLQHVRTGSRVTSASGSADLVLEDHYRVGRWRTPEDRAKSKAAYVVVPWRLVEQHYSPFTVRQVRLLTRQGVVLFSFHGRSYGRVALYRLPVPPTGGHGG